MQEELDQKDRENQSLRDEVEFCKKRSFDMAMGCETENSRKRQVSIAAGSSSVTPGTQEKRHERATLSAITVNQDTTTSSFFVDVKSKAVASSAAAACSRGTDVGDSISLVPTQDSLRGEQATPTQSEGTKTIVLSDRASVSAMP